MKYSQKSLRCLIENFWQKYARQAIEFHKPLNWLRQFFTRYDVIQASTVQQKVFLQKIYRKLIVLHVHLFSCGVVLFNIQISNF